jgi:regulatory protein YycH of two-component signal transduction system YycFG
VFHETSGCDLAVCDQSLRVALDNDDAEVYTHFIKVDTHLVHDGNVSSHYDVDSVLHTKKDSERYMNIPSSCDACTRDSHLLICGDTALSYAGHALL